MVRILTYNVHGCRGADGRIDVARIADVIASVKPDVVALQELDVGRARSQRIDQAHAIADRLGMAFHFHAALRVEEERYGDALLSVFPFRLLKAGPLPAPAGLSRLERRGALWIEVDLPDGRRLQVLNTHLGLVPQEQRVQVDALLGPQWLGHRACQDPVVLLGDFNATERYRAYRRLAARLFDVRRQVSVKGGGRTFPARLPILRIDHIFVSASLEATEVWTVNSAAARLASDHLPLVADLRLRSVKSSQG